MKLSVLLIMGLLAASCEGVRPVFPLGFIGLVEKKDNRVKDDEQDRRLADNERRIALLERLLDAQQAAIDLLYGNINDLEGYDAYLQTIVSSLTSQLNALELQLDIDVTSIGAELLAVEQDIALLQAGTIVELIDPCGDGTGFDEVLLRLGDNTIIAYFQQGNNRHLTVIGAGSYQTTDAQKCNFSVDSAGNVTW